MVFLEITLLCLAPFNYVGGRALQLTSEAIHWADDTDFIYGPFRMQDVTPVSSKISAERISFFYSDEGGKGHPKFKRFFAN